MEIMDENNKVYVLLYLPVEDGVLMEHTSSENADEIMNSLLN